MLILIKSKYFKSFEIIFIMMSSQKASRHNYFAVTHQKHTKQKLTNVPFLQVNLQVGECYN